ncbi:hyaluronan mediated motility receptor [Syngnathoides biaculeatus]|uniref:hyaluronan mediated motility receptor n=1 Tax=Syngnathoides biaculeatus TaxID=300417 RepID=UPI002ADDCC23|nr:hyaluronan mediated motility receptor [Syngnathoides biaculeatus]
MSFSRAPLKRFNEAVGCTPAPGIYDIKPGEPKGPASFDKSDRFKHAKPAVCSVPTSSPSQMTLMSPVRRTVSFDGLVEGSSTKKTLEMKQRRLLEKEIRSLVQQRGEQDRRLLSLEQDLKNLEAKLLAAVREKTALTASITTLQRQKAELKKVNEFLKNKVSADLTKKRINSLTMELLEARNKLDSKNKELSVLEVTTNGHLKALEMDLRVSKETIQALTGRNNDLEELNQVLKTQNEELVQQNDRLHAEILELKAEIKVLQGYLDASNDQIQDLRLKLKETTQQDIVCNAKLQNLKCLEQELVQSHTKLERTEVALRQKEEEVLKYQHEMQASQEALSEAKRKLKSQELELEASQKAVRDLETQVKFIKGEVQNSRAKVGQQEAELALLREALQTTEKKMNESVAHLEQMCLLSAQEKNQIQEEGFRKVKELSTELELLKDIDRDEKEKQIQLQHEHASFIEELAKERALVDSLTVLLEQERQESEECRSKLYEEMEEVLGELALMEDQEQRRGEERAHSHEKMNALERQLSEMKEVFERQSRDLLLVKEEHSIANRELQETHANSLQKMGEMSVQLEGTKMALREADESRKKLEEEMNTVTQQLKEEMDKVILQKNEEHRMRLENAGVLQEVQARLAHKVQEMQDLETSYSERICQLEQELLRQTKDKEEALRQVEEQKGQQVAELHNREQMAQKQLEDVRREKVIIMEQMLQEKEEKNKYQAALEAKRAVLEAEMKDHQQLRSEVLRLQTELNSMCEERSRLVSQVELSDQSELALQHRVEAEHREKMGLQARLDEVQVQCKIFQTQTALMEEKVEGLLMEMEEQQHERQTLQHQVKVLIQEKVTLQWEMDEQRQELQNQVMEAEEKSASRSETEHWRTKYEELFAKVKPFEDQLNFFAAERNALINENGANQEELTKLSDAYARLLGHQNQKQKIKHVMKLKDENFDLKQEVLKLRSQLSRQKTDLNHLKSKPPNDSQRRFDPSKAFQHNKENRRTENATPLKEDNHTVKSAYL